MSSRFATMTDSDLSAYEAEQRQKVEQGHDDGCREYLLAAMLERSLRGVKAAATACGRA